MAITRKRALSSAVMQMVGGALIFFGSVIARSEPAPVATFWIGLAVSIYFLATGFYRLREALKLPRN